MQKLFLFRWDLRIAFSANFISIGKIISTFPTFIKLFHWNSLDGYFNSWSSGTCPWCYGKIIMTEVMNLTHCTRCYNFVKLFCCPGRKPMFLKMGQPLFISNNILQKICKLQQDSNSYCRSRRRARWPQDHHRTTVQFLHQLY